MGDGGNTLINLGDVAEPVKVLIERVSDAIGGIFRPYQITRVAKAEAEAEKIRAIAQIEVSGIQQRGLVRMIEVQAIKQQNIEQITARAANDIKKDAKPQDMEKDWIVNFFDNCETVSDAKMQSLWAKILAGEANRPGTYSKRTVNGVASLDKHEANLFTTLCRFGWMIGTVNPLVYNLKDEIYSKNGLTFDALNHLDSIGLITLNDLTGYVIQGLPTNQKFVVHYYGTPVEVELPENANGTLTTGKVLLTKMGNELAPICGSTSIDGFIAYVKEHWKKQGYIV